MSDARLLGKEEVVIEDQAVSGCMTYAAPVVFLVAGYFVKSSWEAVSGAARPIMDDAPALNLAVGSAILGASLLFCVCAVLVLIGGLWKTKIKFYERGITLHGVGALGSNGRSHLLYGDVECVRITAKHNTREAPAPHRRNRDLLDIVVERLSGAKAERRPEVYESTEYTFSFKLKQAGESVTFSLTADRAGAEIPAIVERLAAEEIRVEREEAREET